jgi:glycosyltransferase involved in cell wall biosynthesis
VATDLGAPPELLITGTGPASPGTGWLVPPADPARLADAIQAVLALPEAGREALAALARRHVIENYSLFEMKRQTLAVYDSMLSSNLATSFATTENPA